MEESLTKTVITWSDNEADSRHECVNRNESRSLFGSCRFWYVSDAQRHRSYFDTHFVLKMWLVYIRVYNIKRHLRQLQRWTGQISSNIFSVAVNLRDKRTEQSRSYWACQSSYKAIELNPIYFPTNRQTAKKGVDPLVVLQWPNLKLFCQNLHQSKTNKQKNKIK